jgi:hypothetical protein
MQKDKISLINDVRKFVLSRDMSCVSLALRDATKSHTPQRLHDEVVKSKNKYVVMFVWDMTPCNLVTTTEVSGETAACIF